MAAYTKPQHTKKEGGGYDEREIRSGFIDLRFERGQVSRTLSHKSSFIPRTCNLWNVLPSSCFAESYNLPSFKSKINKLDHISLSS